MPPKTKFLIVDDVAENLVALEALLRRDDLEVLTARSGTEALELLLVHEIALALIDVNMPDMDGFELAELMRGAERSRHVPIIFVTAASREPQRVFRGYESGAVDFLFKPIDPAILRHKADTFFQLSRQRALLSEQLARIAEHESSLKRAVQIRDDVLAVVSHDLRDPLNVIAMASSVLRQLADERRDQQLQQLSDMLLRSVDRMQRMIGDLLDMASLRSGRLSIDPQFHDLGALVGEAVAAQQPQANERSITLEAEPLPGPIRLKCDRQRLLQVFSNLIGNALKFCEAGACIRLRMEPEEKGVRFAVSDTGPGIAEDDLPMLFEPYWSARKHRKTGTGLGLYITRGIVEAHGGRIWVESRLGQGTTFWFTLPLVATAAQASA